MRYQPTNKAENDKTKEKEKKQENIRQLFFLFQDLLLILLSLAFGALALFSPVFVQPVLSKYLFITLGIVCMYFHLAVA